MDVRPRRVASELAARPCQSSPPVPLSDVLTPCPPLRNAERGNEGEARSPAGRPLAPLQLGASLPLAAPVAGHPALGQAALGGQRSPARRAALPSCWGAAILAGAAIAGPAATRHAAVGLQLFPRRFTRAIVPCDREELVAPRAAQRGDAPIRKLCPMPAAGADDVRLRTTRGARHGPLVGLCVAQLEQGAGHHHGVPTHPQPRLARGEPHDGVPGTPTQPASRGLLQPGPLSASHFVPCAGSVPPCQAAVNRRLAPRCHAKIDGTPARARCSALTRVSSASQPNTGKCEGSNRAASYRTSRNVACTTCSATTGSRRMPRARARRLEEWRTDNSHRARTSPSATCSNRVTSDTGCSSETLWGISVVMALGVKSAPARVRSRSHGGVSHSIITPSPVVSRPRHTLRCRPGLRRLVAQARDAQSVI